MTVVTGISSCLDSSSSILTVYSTTIINLFDVIVHVILTGVHQSDWSRPVGRLYTSWMATLKSDLSLHNLTFEDAIELALDKSLWRLLVASGATH